MNFRNISAWAIRNPVPPIVLFVALTLAGIVSFMGMSVNDSPDIDFPVAIVVITQPGAAPTELETQVTQRVEAAVRSLQGIDEISSTVTEGSSQTVVQLAIGTPIDRAVNDVRDAISQIRGNLPEGILEPQVFRANTTGNDLASYSAVASDMTVEQLSWYIDNTVTKELLSVPGHGRGRSQRRRQPRDPRHPRSRRDAGAGPDREPGQCAAPPHQPGTRRGAARKSPGPNNRSACWATRATPRNWARPRSTSAAVAPCGCPMSHRSATCSPNSAAAPRSTVARSSASISSVPRVRRTSPSITKRSRS